MRKNCVLTILIIHLCGIRALSQIDDVPIASWMFAGTTYSHSNVMHSAQYADNAYLDTEALYLQSLLNTTNHITLNPAYLSIRMPNAYGNKQTYHTLMHGVIFKFTRKRMSIDNRNILWHWLMDGEDMFIYRNRCRLFYSFSLLSLESKIYIVDEGSFSLKDKSLIRNRFGTGLLLKPSSALSFEFVVMRQRDIESRPLNLLVLMATLNINSLRTSSK